MKKILLVATVQSHIAQFHKPLISWLDGMGYQVDVAAGFNLDTKPNLHLEVPGTIYDVPFSRSPFSLKNIKAYKSLRSIIKNGNYDVVHCNTPVGGILTRLAANAKRKKQELKVVYEAHGFHFFQGGAKKNWLLWYPIEKWFSRYTDVLITINKMDYELALDKFKAKAIKYIPGVGVDLNQFMNNEAICNLREEYHLPEGSKILISVGELNENKNHQVIIRALAHLNDDNIHYFLVGNGPLKSQLEELASTLGVQEHIHFLGYRRDVPALMKNADAFVFPSMREGLGMASIEAMASGLPIITSNRHGINDYSIAGKTGYKYHPDDVVGFAEGISKIVYDSNMRNEMGEHNIELSKQFTVEASMNRLSEIYLEMLNDGKFSYDCNTGV